MRSVLAGVLMAGALAGPAGAQTPAPAAAPAEALPDRFQIDTGYFRLDAQTILRFNGGPVTGDVDFEKDLGVPPQVNTFWVDATWRVGRRHQLKLSFTRLSRERDDRTLQRDLVWGGETFNAGLTGHATTGSDLLGGYYHFALFRNDRFEIGPSVGVGYLWLRAGIEATGTITGPGGSPVSRNLQRSASTGAITGALGGYTAFWPLRRLALRGDFLYIKVGSDLTESSVKDWRLGADVYFLRNVGLGVQYKYNHYTQQREILDSKLGGDVIYKGVQVFASFLF